MALCFALNGAEVLLKDGALDLATSGKKRIEGIFSKWEGKGKIEKDQSKKAMDRINPRVLSAALTKRIP